MRYVYSHYQQISKPYIHIQGVQQYSKAKTVYFTLASTLVVENVSMVHTVAQWRAIFFQGKLMSVPLR